MGEPHLRVANLWKRKQDVYPDAISCTGDEVGLFCDRTWWQAQGLARQKFSMVEAEILDTLETSFTDRCPSILILHLYMIGRCVKSAHPTIKFSCEEKEPRKKAKKAIDESGILAKLPGFRTSHLSRQPGLGKLMQPATEGRRVRPSNEIEPSTEVYFDSSRPVKALGMPIFVKQASGTLRQATANAVFKKGKFVYLSASHVFFNDDARLRANSPN